jgi:hypothetical protein
MTEPDDIDEINRRCQEAGERFDREMEQDSGEHAKRGKRQRQTDWAKTQKEAATGDNGKTEQTMHGSADDGPGDEDDARDHSKRQEQQSREQTNGNAKLQPLTFRGLFDIFGMDFDDDDFLIRNGYLTKGEACTICGAGNIGKSRLVSQLIRDILIGNPFLGRWQTNGKDIMVMVLQSENSCRRIKADLWAQCSKLREDEKTHIHDHCVWHTLENADDSFLTLASTENQQRIEEAIALYKPDLIVWDVLRDFAIDDPNSDRDMQASLSVIGRLTRKYNSKCVALILHHGRTGKAGAASVTGWDRNSFGRNSKVLFSWTRAQINVAAYTPDNKTLIIASGKCNNAEEFKPFAVTLNTDTMSYEVDESVTQEDIEVWHEEMGAGSGTKKKKEQRKSPEQIKEIIIKLVQEAEGEIIPKNDLLTYAAEKVGRDNARDYLRIAVRENRLFEGSIKEGRGRPVVHVSTKEIAEPVEETKKIKKTRKSKKIARTKQTVNHDELAAE